MSWRFKCFTVLAWTQFFVLAGIATYYLLTPSPGDTFSHIWDKALHFSCWFILLNSLYLPWLFRPKFWWAAVALFGYSVVTETLQQFSPPREFSYLDMLANGVGIITAFVILRLLNGFLQQTVIKKLSTFLQESLQESLKENQTEESP